MREQGAAARFLPSDRIAESAEIHFGQDESALAGEMALERGLDLIGGRKVDVAVGVVVGRPFEPPVGLEANPVVSSQSLVNCTCKVFVSSITQK